MANHGFADGNKRTALLLVQLLLRRSGYSLDADGPAVLELIVGVADHTVTYDELVVWLRERIVRNPSAAKAAVQTDRSWRFSGTCRLDRATSAFPLRTRSVPPCLRARGGTGAVRTGWLDRHGLAARPCAIICVRGASMEPTLPDGCSIMFDRNRRERRIYVVCTDGRYVVKRAAPASREVRA